MKCSFHMFIRKNAPGQTPMKTRKDTELGARLSMFYVIEEPENKVVDKFTRRV